MLALVAKLVARNSELERRLAELMAPRKSREGVPTAQLLLLLDELSAQGQDEGGHDQGGADDDRGRADGELREASGIDEAARAAEGEAKPRKQPPLRRPIPDDLPRVDNLLPVPDQERACPECGAERACIGHDVTEVIELEPARVIVRRDLRQKLAILPRVLPFLVIIAGVLYVLYGGIATPSEAAGVGALFCILVVFVIYGLIMRNWAPIRVWEILGDTMRESVMILMIIGASALFSYMLSSLFITQSIAGWIAELEVNRWVLMAMINFFLLICGMIFTASSGEMTSASMPMPLARLTLRDR